MIDAFKKLFGKNQQAAEKPGTQTAASAEPTVKSILDFTPGDDIALGVKSTSRYSWYILPPAGWRRTESTSSAVWPGQGISPHVTFSCASVAPGEQASIRWQLSATPETAESHALLDDLFAGRKSLTEYSVAKLEAPGLITGMKIQRMEKLVLPTGQGALLLTVKQDQCRGEPAVLRHVFILPDRNLQAGATTQWYRESIQFVASENSFWSNERLALESIKSFRRAVEDQTTSGTFAINQAAANTIR